MRKMRTVRNAGDTIVYEIALYTWTQLLRIYAQIRLELGKGRKDFPEVSDRG